MTMDIRQENGVTIIEHNPPLTVVRADRKLFEQITAADLNVGDSIAYNEHGETDTILELDVLEDGDVSILYQGTVAKMKEIRGDTFDKRESWWGPINSDEMLLREVKS